MKPTNGSCLITVTRKKGKRSNNISINIFQCIKTTKGAVNSVVKIMNEIMDKASCPALFAKRRGVTETHDQSKG